jgi:hypothetical protein
MRELTKTRCRKGSEQISRRPLFAAADAFGSKFQAEPEVNSGRGWQAKQPRQPSPVLGGRAVECGQRPRAPQQQVRGVLPGESDPAQDLDE